MLSNVEKVTKFFNGENISDILGDKSDKYDKKNIWDIYNYTDYKLETDHSFIQWIFPTQRPSAFNPTAPTLTYNEILMLKHDENIIEWLQKFKNKMFSYWGIKPVDSNRLLLLNGHNGLRLSRAIECLTLFGIFTPYDFSNFNIVIAGGFVRNIIYPHMEKYEDKTIPIWCIRYHEAMKLCNTEIN